MEAESLGWCVGGYLVAHAVDDDMVVKPTQCGEVVRLRLPALGPGDAVVGLEPVAGDTAVGCAASVTVEDEPFEFGWDDPARSSHCEWGSVGGVDVFD